jgi:hypothetical protein
MVEFAISDTGIGIAQSISCGVRALPSGRFQHQATA